MKTLFISKLIGNQSQENEEIYLTFKEAEKFAKECNDEFKKEYESEEAYYDDNNSQEYVVYSLKEYITNFDPSEERISEILEALA